MHHGAVQTAARRPRDNSAWPKVAARRGLSRPARGFDLPEVRDLAVTVQALDAIDGMPVLDLKPYMREFGARRPGRASDLVHGAHSRILEHLRRELRARPGTYRESRWATTGTDLAPGRLHSRRSALC